MEHGRIRLRQVSGLGLKQGSKACPSLHPQLQRGEGSPPPQAVGTRRSSSHRSSRVRGARDRIVAIARRPPARRNHRTKRRSPIRPCPSSGRRPTRRHSQGRHPRRLAWSTRCRGSGVPPRWPRSRGQRFSAESTGSQTTPGRGRSTAPRDPDRPGVWPTYRERRGFRWCVPDSTPRQGRRSRIVAMDPGSRRWPCRGSTSCASSRCHKGRDRCDRSWRRASHQLPRWGPIPSNRPLPGTTTMEVPAAPRLRNAGLVWRHGRAS